jgi:hypothetical protein
MSGAFPIIDIGPFLCEDASSGARAAVVGRIGEAC